VLETDDEGAVISYEEYHPYGTSAYRVAKSAADLSLKRYRFSGKERDDETGLYYFGARYYAAWLGRWTSSDPKGFVDGNNLFRYCKNNPVNYFDPKGTKPVLIKKAGVTGNETFEDLSSRAIPEGYEWDPSVTQENYRSFYSTPGKKGGIWQVWRIKGENSAPENASQASTAVGVGSQTARNNPPGFTKELPDNADPEKVRDYKKAIRNERSVGINPDSTAQQRAQRSAGRQARDTFVNNNTRPPNSQAPSGNWDVDHRIEIQDDISGRSGLDPNDYRYQDRSLNRSQGASNRWTKVGQLNEGIPAGTPAGGVARTSEMGRFWNREWFRTGMRYGGYGLLGAGTVLSAYSFAKDIENGNWGGAALSGSGFASGALEISGLLANSSRLVTAGRLLGAPGAVISSGLLGWQVGTYINENSGIQDTAMSVGEWAEGWSGNVYVGATFAAGSAIVTAPYYAGEAIANGVVDLWNWAF
jgi:RHS repeat-associated protein